MALDHGTGTSERTPLLDEVAISATSNGNLSRQVYQRKEEEVKELSSGRLSLVLGVVWFGSFLAAFGNQRKRNNHMLGPKSG